MKVIITGARTLTDHWLLEAALTACPFAAEITEVVCGGEDGADALGDHWAFHPATSVAYFLIADHGIVPMTLLRRLWNLRSTHDCPTAAPIHTRYENIHVRSDWVRDGPAARTIRNAAMVAYADALIALVDLCGGERETTKIIELARARGLRVHLHPVGRETHCASEG